MCVYYMTGAPEGSPKVVLRRSRESNLRPLVYKTQVYPQRLLPFYGTLVNIAKPASSGQLLHVHCLLTEYSIKM